MQDTENIAPPPNREVDLRIIQPLKEGRHHDVLDLTPAYRTACTPGGNFAHELMVASALGCADWTATGTQYSEYENALGTGNAIVWFDA